MKAWLDNRCPPLTAFIKHMNEFPTRNKPNWILWTLGAVLIAFLAFLIPSGLILALSYTPTQNEAFLSVASIMHRVPAGWFIRSLHQAGVSFFFLALYLHMARGFMCFSYRQPRELVWLSGWGLFAVFLLTAFAGYVLPWGQMSYWATTVVINALNDISPSYFSLGQYLLGSSSLGEPGNPDPGTIVLHRAFTLHFLIGLGSIALIGWHIVCVHALNARRSGNNPETEPLSKKARRLPFTPYFAINDLAVVSVVLVLFCAVVFFFPLPFGETDNLIPANPNLTPAHIRPQWYLTPFFSVLRSVPSAAGGIVICCLLLLSSALMPWLDYSTDAQQRRPKGFIIFPLLYCISFVGLGYFGMKATTGYEIWIARTCIVWLLTYPFIFLPVWSYCERENLFPSKEAK